MCCFDIRPLAFLFRVLWGFFLSFFPFFLSFPDGGILGLAFGVLSAGLVALWVLFFFRHWFGVCGVVVLHIFGPEHYSSFFFYSFTTLVLQLLRLLRLSLLHYTVLHYNCFSLFVTRLVRQVGDCSRPSCYYGWGGFFLLCLAGLVAFVSGYSIGPWGLL